MLVILIIIIINNKSSRIHNTTSGADRRVNLMVAHSEDRSRMPAHRSSSELLQNDRPGYRRWSADTRPGLLTGRHADTHLSGRPATGYSNPSHQSGRLSPSYPVTSHLSGRPATDYPTPSHLSGRSAIRCPSTSPLSGRPAIRCPSTGPLSGRLDILNGNFAYSRPDLGEGPLGSSFSGKVANTNQSIREPLMYWTGNAEQQNNINAALNCQPSLNFESFQRTSFLSNIRQQDCHPENSSYRYVTVITVTVTKYPLTVHSVPYLP